MSEYRVKSNGANIYGLAVSAGLKRCSQRTVMWLGAAQRHGSLWLLWLLLLPAADLVELQLLTLSPKLNEADTWSNAGWQTHPSLSESGSKRSYGGFSALSAEGGWFLLTSNRLAVSSSSSCSSWFLTCDRRSHSLSFSFSSWVMQKKMSQPQLTRKRICIVNIFRPLYALVSLRVLASSRLQHPLCSIQLFPEDLGAFFSDFFFSDFQWGAAEPGEVTMVSAWGGHSLASPLHSGLWLWIQIYQPKQHHEQTNKHKRALRRLANFLHWVTVKTWLPICIVLLAQFCGGGLVHVSELWGQV